MRNAQGMPVNMIVLTALALLVLVVVAAFFITGFGQASGSIQTVEKSQADCQGYCQSLSISAFNYADCASLYIAASGTIPSSGPGKNYVETCDQYGACRVSIRGGKSCVCGPTACVNG